MRISWKVHPCRRWMALFVAIIVAACGCSRHDEIQTYTVKKPLPADRMLAAIVPVGENAWFVKASGSNQQLGDCSDEFRTFVQSIQFGDDGDPKWELPDGWKVEQSSGGIRYATISIDSDIPLELTVTRLPITSSGDLDSYILSNINRWRGQLQLRNITLDQLPLNSEAVDVAGTKATLVNMVGNLSASPPMGSAPFASGGSRPPATAAPPRTSPPKITYDAPETWIKGDLVVSRQGIQIRRQAAFTIGSGDKQADVTVTSLPGSKAMLLANINRWRGQVGLGAISEAELGSESDSIDIAGTEGSYVRLRGEDQSIFGVVAFRDGLAWFIKMQGNRDVVQGEQERFEQFATSIKFSE